MTEVNSVQVVQLSKASLSFHVYQLHDDEPGSEELEDDISAANHWMLPAGIQTSLHGGAISHNLAWVVALL